MKTPQTTDTDHSLIKRKRKASSNSALTIIQSQQKKASEHNDMMKEVFYNLSKSRDEYTKFKEKQHLEHTQSNDRKFAAKQQWTAVRMDAMTRSVKIKERALLAQEKETKLNSLNKAIECLDNDLKREINDENLKKVLVDSHAKLLKKRALLFINDD